MKYLVILFLLLATPCYAGVFSANKAAYLHPDDDNMKKDHLFQLSGELGWEFNKYLEAGLKNSRAGFKSGWESKFTEYDLLCFARGKYPIGRWDIYFTGAVGHAWFTDKDLKRHAQTTETLTASHSIAIEYGPGVQYNFNDKLAVFTEFDYHYSNTGEDSSLDSYGWSYGAGVRWYW